MTLDIDSHGRIFAKCQVTDYRCRGDGLSGYNLLQFFVDTYKTDIETRDRKDDEDDIDRDTYRGPGCPCNDRICYLDEHPKAKRQCRVLRSRGHRNLPNFIGCYFPQRDDPKIYPFYCACMLVLLKPWQDLKTDLKSPSQTWPDAFRKFICTAPQHTHFILSGIQYFHDCQTAAKESRNDENIFVDDTSRGGQQMEADNTDFFGLGEDIMEADHGLSEEGLENLIAAQTPLQEETHGRLAVEIAKRAKIFSSDTSRWSLNEHSSVGNATSNDFSNLIAWKAQMKSDVLAQNTNMDPPQSINDADTGGSVGQLNDPDSSADERAIALCT